MSDNLENMEQNEELQGGQNDSQSEANPLDQAPSNPLDSASSNPLDELAPEVNVAELEDMDDSKPKKTFIDAKLDFLQDLELDVYIELGRAKMKIKDILELERGYVIELDKLASEPVDIYVNNKKIADGEVVVIDKHFGIRIMNLNDPAKKLGEMY